MWPVWASFPASHSSEAIYGAEVSEWGALFDVQESSRQIGYALDAFGGNMAALVVIGLVWRAINFVLLVSVNRSKQR